MLKKLLLVGVGLALLFALFMGRESISYLSTTMGWVQESVKDNVPVKFEIERARKMIRDLDPEIERNMRKIAMEEVEIANLRDNLQTAQQQVAKTESDIQRLARDLKRGDTVYVYASHTYTSDQVKQDLTRRLDRVRVKKATVNKLDMIIAAREKGLAAAQETLKAMRQAQSDLEVEIENLEARLEMIEVAKASSSVSIDDSRLARLRGLIDEIGARVEVDEKLLNADTEYPDQIQLDEPETKDVLEEVAEYFGQDAADEYLVELE